MQVATMKTTALVAMQLSVATVAPPLPMKEKVLKKHPIKVNPELAVKYVTALSVMTLSPIVTACPEPPRQNRPGHEPLPTHVFDRIVRHRIDVVPVAQNKNPPAPTFEAIMQN
jgi:hypothetical protein